MVRRSQRKVCEAAVLGQVTVDCDGVASLWTKIVQQLGHTLRAIGLPPERVDDPDLAEVDSRRNGCRLGVAGNELDILDAAALGPSALP